jgi:hypothetical protein
MEDKEESVSALDSSLMEDKEEEGTYGVCRLASRVEQKYERASGSK